MYVCRCVSTLWFLQVPDFKSLCLHETPWILSTGWCTSPCHLAVKCQNIIRLWILWHLKLKLRWGLELGARRFNLCLEKDLGLEKRVPRGTQRSIRKIMHKFIGLTLSLLLPWMIYFTSRKDHLNGKIPFTFFKRYI